MCQKCVKQQYPQRDRTCLESGSYILNFRGCTQCGVREPMNVKNKECTTDDSGDENIQYEHVCSQCGHVVAHHMYSFTVVEGDQEYEMNCLLCGTGEDTVAAFSPR